MARPDLKELVAFEGEEPEVPREVQEGIVVTAGEMVTGDDWQVLRYVSGS